MTAPGDVTATVDSDPQTALGAALEYAEIGWAVFAVHSLTDGQCSCGKPECDRPGKHPRWEAETLGHGCSDATTDPRLIEHWWCRWPGAQIAVNCGRSRFFVVDVDDREGRRGSAAFAALHGINPIGASLVATTPSGGRHYFFAMPDGAPVSSTSDVIAPGIDTRGVGGYVILPSPASPGRDWADGEPGCDLSSHLQWLDPVLPRVHTTAEAPAGRDRNTVCSDSGNRRPLPEGEVAEIRDALRFVCNDSRSDWLRIGMALKSTGAGAQAFELWSAWSNTTEHSKLWTTETDHRPHPKFDPQDQHYQWNSLVEYFPDGSEITIRTLFHMAKEGGWSDPTQIVASPVPTEARAIAPEDATEAPPDPFPLDLIEGGNLLGDVAQWIVDTGPKPQPALSLASTIATIGAVVRRRIEGQTGLRTNFYNAGVADSGHGKDWPLRAPPILLNAANLGSLAHSGWKSGSALVRELEKTPASVALIDEYGLVLAAHADRRAGLFQKEIRRYLLELFGCASGTFLGESYADTKINPRAIVIEPNLCLYGCTTPGPFFAALQSDAITDGFLNRHLVFWGADKRPETRIAEPRNRRLPEIAARLCALDEATRPPGTEGLPAGVPPALGSGCRTIPFADNGERWVALARASDARTDAMRAADDRCADLWNRFPEHVAKLALLHAICRDPHAATVTDADITWAERLASWCIRRLAAEGRRRIADSQTEADVLRVLRIIEAAGSKGIRGNMLTRKCQWLRRSERKDVLQTLADSRQIRVENSGTPQNPSTTYYAERDR